MNESYFVIRHSPSRFSIALEWLWFFLHCLYWQKASIALGKTHQSHCCPSPAVEFLLTPTIPSTVRRHSIQLLHFPFSPLSALFSVFISTQFTMEKDGGGTASFICIFLLLYNFMVFRFNLMWKNEDGEIGLSANWLWQKTRAGQFPVKIQAERMRKRKTPSVCSPSPKGRDCRECALTTDPELPPTSPKQTANGHIIWNW